MSAKANFKKNLTTSQKRIVRRYVWGHVLNAEAIGPYFVLTAEERGGDNSAERFVTAYHPYVQDAGDWVDTNASFPSLDEARAHAIAYRVEGPNTRADGHFIRGLRRD
jgi:hypothetical protein